MSWRCRVFGHVWSPMNSMEPFAVRPVAFFCQRCQAIKLCPAPPSHPAPDVTRRVLARGKSKPVVYVAHPLGHGDDRELNRTNAAQWCAYLAEAHGIAPVAPWIVIAGVWEETKRALGFEIDLAIIERCDELWLVGGRITEGMALEAEHAAACGITVRDLTSLGYLPPLDLGCGPKGDRP